MRFNSKELAVLAQQDSSKFDKEGTLFMKQKNDKLFKKGEGVLVLERCAVELDVNEQNSFSFVIVFEGDEVTYTFSALTEEERDDWIQTLHDASYEYRHVRVRTPSSRCYSQTQAWTLKPGLLLIPATLLWKSASAPNPFAVVYIIVPPQQQNWLQHSHTEMVEKNNNPHFLKTIGFGDTACLETSTRVKIAIYHVKERMTGTMTMIGHVIFTLNELLLSDTMSLKFAIVGPDSSKVGTLSIVSWLNDTNDAVTDLQEHNDRFSDRPPSIRARPLSMRCRSKRLEMLKPVCDNIVTRTFRFDTNDSNKLLVHEYMADSKFTFEIPMKVLQLLISEEQRRIKELQDIGQIPGVLGAACREYLDKVLLFYDVTVSSIGRSFKASTKKSDRELEFAPLNLHLQRMIVLNEANAQFGCYDTITVGAFVAHARKFRAGGLSVKDLVQNCEKPILQETAAKLADVHEEMEALSEQSGKQEGPHSRATGSPGFGRKTTQSEAPELKWKWTGSCFIKSPTIEPWEHKDNLKLMHTIKTRRDIVFSQALSSLVFGLVLHVTSLLDHPHVFPQLAGLGCLVQVEGLLSCHGEDVPLLEDMIVALDDLSTVLKRACHYPDLSRHHVCIEIPIPKSGFDQLPSNLKSGSEIKLIPLFFNIGINEQGTLAERFGNTSLQDKANEESFGRLHNYVEEYKDKFMDKSSGANSVGSIPSLVQQLHTNVYTKKSKNVEILHLAAESAKDRTAMAVTLEQVQILQRDHNLASHVFMQSLDCFRSEGVRRENTFKNVGLRKYAFNSLQLLSFPKQYRPPNGTYGNVQTALCVEKNNGTINENSIKNMVILALNNCKLVFSCPIIV
ncbi:INP4A-like protein [Mya arenaria]|uniref:INP4A-like protein n=1 Tax=Mya arenaria TaxID=6604 RepID=A0ABY7DPK1_MYAAR|nr:INP4A-like protein [Mya arenaria]